MKCEPYYTRAELRAALRGRRHFRLAERVERARRAARVTLLLAVLLPVTRCVAENRRETGNTPVYVVRQTR